MIDFKNNLVVQELVERIQSKKIIPFIGAGLSYKFGLPNWKDLVESIVDKTAEVSNIDRDYIRQEIKDKRDLLETIEYLMIEAKISKQEILSNIIHRPKTSKIVSEDHESLALLDLPIIYTTNWDDIIEKTYKRLKLPYMAIESSRDFLKIDGNKTTIVKFHGSIKYPETLVLTESDYYERFGIDSPFDIRFRSDLFERSILFLGTSLRDYNIRYIWNRTQKNLEDTLQEKPPCSYYVSVYPDRIQETILTYNNIKTINLGSPSNFSSFMKYLSDTAN